MYENGGVGLKKKERKKEKERKKKKNQKKKNVGFRLKKKERKKNKEEEKKSVIGDVTMHWRRGPLRQLIYWIATESRIMSFE